jgi:hypothetical protein
MKNRSIAERITKPVTQPDDLWSSTPLELLLKRVTETWRHDALAGKAVDRLLSGRRMLLGPERVGHNSASF